MPSRPSFSRCLAWGRRCRSRCLASSSRTLSRRGWSSGRRRSSYDPSKRQSQKYQRSTCLSATKMKRNVHEGHFKFESRQKKGSAAIDFISYSIRVLKIAVIHFLKLLTWTDFPRAFLLCCSPFDPFFSAEHLVSDFLIWHRNLLGKGCECDRHGISSGPELWWSHRRDSHSGGCVNELYYLVYTTTKGNLDKINCSIPSTVGEFLFFFFLFRLCLVFLSKPNQTILN